MKQIIIRINFADLKRIRKFFPAEQGESAASYFHRLSIKFATEQKISPTIFHLNTDDPKKILKFKKRLLKYQEAIR